MQIEINKPIKIKDQWFNPVWSPQAGPQSDFLSSVTDYIGFGGAFGGGKSEALMALPTRFSHYNDYKVLFLRRTYKQLEDILERCKRLYSQLGWTWQGSIMKWRAPSGAFIEFGHCLHPGDEDNYLSKEYNTIIIDQSEQFTDKMIRKISARCRTSNPDIPPQVYMSFNPGGPGHLWVKNNFVDRCPTVNRGEKVYNEKFDIWWQPKKAGAPYKDRFGLTWQFHPAIVFDNPKLIDNDPSYVLRLLSLPEDEREAYLWGNFEMFGGQYFKEWSREVHIIPMRKLPDIPYTWGVYGGNDYASSGWWFGGVAAVNPHGEVIIVEEDYFTGGTLRKKAKRMDMLIEKYPRMKKWAAPWDMFNEIRDRDTEQVQGTIVQRIKDHMEYEIEIVKAPKDRIDGWELIKDGLTWMEKVKPWLYIRENCHKLIETLPSMIHDEGDNRDIDPSGWCHGVDFLRYILQVIKRKKKVLPVDAYDEPKRKLGTKVLDWRLR